MPTRNITYFYVPKQNLNDVFLEMYRLELALDDKKVTWHDQFIIIRLVTLIEQFFRNIAKIQLESNQTALPQNITLSTPILDDIIHIASEKKRSINKELIISISHSFQNTKTIKDVMTQYGLKDALPNSKIVEYDKLFTLRHEFAHTLHQPPKDLDLKQYYLLVEELMKYVLEKIDKEYLDFYFLKGNVVRKLGDKNKKRIFFEKMIQYFDGRLKQ